MQKAVKVVISCGKIKQGKSPPCPAFVFGAQFPIPCIEQTSVRRVSSLTTLVGKIINSCIFKRINSFFVYLLIKVCVWRMIRLKNVKYRWQSYGYYNYEVSDVIEGFATGNLQRFTAGLLLH